MTPEGKVKRRLNKRLQDLYGEQVYRFMPVQTGYGAPALDYFLCANGRFVAIETKAKGKKPTPRQLSTMDAIRKAGGFTYVVDDYESLERAMHAIGQMLKWE